MTTDVPPVYGSVGSNATNNPGSRYNSVVWLDANDNFYMFGGSQGHTESTQCVHITKLNTKGISLISGNTTAQIGLGFGLQIRAMLWMHLQSLVLVIVRQVCTIRDQGSKKKRQSLTKDIRALSGK